MNHSLCNFPASTAFKTILTAPSATASLLLNRVAVRGIRRIPHWENHIRFDPKFGRKIPQQDVLNRFKRLNNGMWIRRMPGLYKQRYNRDEPWLTTSMYYYTCTKEECFMLDRMMSPYWLRPKYYPDDPYEAFHKRHGLKTPRVDYGGKFVRERRKILLEDTVADQHFYDR